MSEAGHDTFQEIISQPSAWGEALVVGSTAYSSLRDLFVALNEPQLLFTGCGSTYYLSLAAAALAEETGLPARAVPASELWLAGRPLQRGAAHTLLVSVSRSGETTETLQAIQAYRRAGGKAVVAVTCEPDSSMARSADLTLALPGARERSTAQTRSFASMLVLCQLVVGAFKGDSSVSERLASLPAIGQRIISDNTPLLATLGGDRSIERFFYLGNGPCYGLAQEGMLKMKEMSLSNSEAFHVLELRHGPKSMVDEGALVVGLLSDDSQQEASVLVEMRALRGRTLEIVETAANGAPAAGGEAVVLRSGLALIDRLVLYMPILQLLAFYRSAAKGVDPDSPRNLTAVVTL